MTQSSTKENYQSDWNTHTVIQWWDKICSHFRANNNFDLWTPTSQSLLKERKKKNMNISSCIYGWKYQEERKTNLKKPIVTWSCLIAWKSNWLWSNISDQYIFKMIFKLFFIWKTFKLIFLNYFYLKIFL